MKVAVIIPFRDRGVDPRRAANLDMVQAWWYANGCEPQIVDDGLEGDVQFNRHRAYNRAVSRNHDADVFVFTEADMLIHPEQVRTAIYLAEHEPGLVVPFTQYRYLSDSMTEVLRQDYHDSASDKIASWWDRPANDPTSVFGLTPESVMDNGKSIGAVNVVSRYTLDLTGGFTEATRGNWYDDNIIEEGFAFLLGNKTRVVDGPAVHLYHLPGHKGDHLSDEDRRATRHNKIVLDRLRRDIRQRNVGAVLNLMSHRSPR
jgi:hypothetical protein